MNNLETEFKFRIDKLPTINFSNVKKHYIKQIYFDGRKKIDVLKNYFPDVDFEMINTYRIRYIDDIIILTIKSKAIQNGFSRIEEEKEIKEIDVEKLISDTDSNIIIKNRYIDYYQGYKFEFDEYLNLGTNLFTVEIEVDKDFRYEDNVNKLIELVMNHYQVECQDVTFDPIYKNSNLHKYFG